jgi:hypothetical protein
VRISNSGSELLSLTVQQYEQYIKIHPKYLYQHKYIKIVRNKIEIDSIKYCADHFNLTGGHKYYFCIQNNIMSITYGEPVDKKITYCVLTPDVVEHLNNIAYAKYTPSSVTSLMVEVDEVKQLILPLNIQLKVEFNY